MKGGVKVNKKELEKHMIESDVTNVEMAKRLNISDSAWYRKKTGVTQFDAREIREVAKVLNLNEKEIMSIFFHEKVS